MNKNVLQVHIYACLSVCVYMTVRGRLLLLTSCPYYTPKTVWDLWRLSHNITSFLLFL